ncbi:MAG: MobA/MobL family protein [Acidaminococcaceae bacterium]|nr:MobA/MobL family protein [Acidaminococcaceae bacterium]
MAIHYLGDIRHVTCQTASGHRRSPMIDIAYNSGQVLTDTTTGRQHSRPHRDGTVILATDIVSADENCPYGDTSVPSAQRREKMYNELYSLNKNNSERVYAKTELGLPDSYTDEQAVIVAKATALSFSKRLGIPMDFSVHKKRVSKRNPHKNLHVHLAFAERKWEYDHWGAKSVSYYIDMDGNILYDKQYKDENGNDIRKPRIKKDAPESEKYKRDSDGHYIYQVRDKKGRRKWCMVQTEGLSPADLTWMHEEVDRINNHYLSLFNIPDRVQRNDKRVTKKLKELDMQPVHIGRKDFQERNENYAQKIAWNKKANFYRDALTDIYKTHNKLAELETKMDKEEKESAENLLAATEKFSIEKQAMDSAKLDYQSALTDYVEELHPQEIFVQNGLNILGEYFGQREKILTETANILQAGIRLADKELSTLKQKTTAEKYPIKKGYLTKNKSFMIGLLSSVRQYAQRVPVVKTVTKYLVDRWQSFSSTGKVAYIRDTVGQEEGILYADYLNIGETKNEAPKHFTFSVPKIDTEDKIISTLQKWKNNATYANHYPPMNTNLLKTIQTQDSLIMGADTVENIIPNGYTPIATYNAYIKELEAIQQQKMAKIQQSVAASTDSQSVAANAERSIKIVAETDSQSVTASLEPSAKNVKENEGQSVTANTEQPLTNARDTQRASATIPNRQSVAANTEHVDWSRKEYDRISALTDAEKMRKIIETAEARIRAGTDYTKEELITRYKKHSREFAADMKRFGINHDEYDRLSAERKAYWQLGPKYRAIQEQKNKSVQERTADRESAQTIRR